MYSLETGNYLMALNCAYTMCKKGGYSAKLLTLEEPVDGYMVAIFLIKKYPNISSVNVHKMTSILRDFAQNLNKEDMYIGTWVDPTTNEVYFEISLNIDDLEKAINIGKIHDQRFIYSVKDNNLIELK